MMAAMMTSKNSCQFKYQKSFSKFYKQSSINAAQTALPKRAVLSAVFGVLVLSGCQTTPTNDLLGNSPYQTSTRASNDRNLDQQEIARVRTSLAAQYIRKNELDTAQQQLEKAFAADSRYAPAYDMMGVLLQQEGSRINLAKADEYFKKAIALDKDFVQAHNNYGVYLSQTKRYREAAEQFEIAGATLGYEGRIGALENLGRTYLQLGDNSAASKAFLRALDGNRNSIIAHIELVDLLLQQQRVPQAQRLYDETLILVQGQGVSPRLLLQGIKLAAAQSNITTRQQLAQQLLSAYPLSDEAKQLKTWLNNPEAPWK
ncbi:type IV pilus biogenesis/stability protein PilW [Psychrobacter sp. Choline-02u-13]|nr:type IV pilus biogenesis/stability protein PilW [Psychrobacter sp. Urea-trap-18]MBA6286734.1 type IV pilus biogenesis/stability protein PilW [Psychrobacter sp. Urea-trap-16]MBA6317807.1 type IV pilus biogenesis/stability protein PilW [Psychrobacter sp. Urea-trap-20]MBA6334458.1 type IV pilus biogenesis/stability protein PilW [Psychrobacter sp. Urea-trap-19]OEH68473.1 MAG: type IV pilus biogenesis/stability protein PilW [Psychrobacter sp. B29-1]PKG59648.1 type IV pilus biogenesis/stability p|tara:strand:+ start:77192 stop:78139 length:948 start_codon:yes stop_codon:yes gene_type:complete